MDARNRPIVPAISVGLTDAASSADLPLPFARDVARELFKSPLFDSPVRAKPFRRVDRPLELTALRPSFSFLHPTATNSAAIDLVNDRNGRAFVAAPRPVPFDGPLVSWPPPPKCFKMIDAVV